MGLRSFLQFEMKLIRARSGHWSYDEAKEREAGREQP